MAEIVFIVPGTNNSLQALPELLPPSIDARLLSSPNEALWEIQQHKPRAIIADLELPGMSGLDLAELVPNFSPETQIILTTRQPDLGVQVQAKNFGVREVLEGEQSAAALREALYRVLKQAAMSTAPAPPSPPPAPAKPPAQAVPTTQPPPAPATPAAAREEPAPTAVEQQPRPVPRRGTGPLVLTEQTLSPVRLRLQELAGELGARVIILSDVMGAPLVQIGSADVPLVALLPLLATSFSTSAELTRMLREKEGGTLYFHEGSRYDVYAFDVGHRLVLVLLFDKLVGASKIGPVWVYTKRAVRDLLESL